MLNKAVSKTSKVLEERLITAVSKIILLFNLEAEEVKLERLVNYYPFEGFQGVDSKTGQEVSHTMVEDVLINNRTVLKNTIFTKRMPGGKIEATHKMDVQIPEEEYHELLRAHEQRNG